MTNLLSVNTRAFSSHFQDGKLLK